MKYNIARLYESFVEEEFSPRHDFPPKCAAKEKKLFVHHVNDCEDWETDESHEVIAIAKGMLHDAYRLETSSRSSVRRTAHRMRMFAQMLFGLVRR